LRPQFYRLAHASACARAAVFKMSDVPRDVLPARCAKLRAAIEAYDEETHTHPSVKVNISELARKHGGSTAVRGRP